MPLTKEVNYMANFNVRITEDDSTLNLYDDVNKITIVDNDITVDCEDESFTHRMDQTDEIIIRANR